MKYRPDIDGLRAVAVMPVLFFHAGIPWFPGGFVGVDVFFVISGYLITTIITQEIREGRFSLWRFYERRLRRIAPALLVVCMATVPFAWAWMTPNEFDDFAQSLFATALSVSNFLFWKEVGYFAPAAELKPLLHTWSLAIEEQFYVVLPLLLLLVRPAGRALAVIAALAVLSFGATFWLSGIDDAANFYLLPTRFWELAVGALLALAGPRLRIGNALARNLASVLGLGLIVGAILFVDGARTYPGPWTLLPVAGTAILLALSNGGTWAGRLLSAAPLVGIGLISYSLYLWHQPLFAFARIRLFEQVPQQAYLILIAAAVALAWLSWRFIETPFRDRRRIGTRPAMSAIGVTCLGLFAFGLAADQMEERLERHRDGSIAASIEDNRRVNIGLSLSCDGRLPLPESCRTSDEPEILVWGDSYAMHLVPGIVASKPDARLVQFTMSFCGPLLDAAPVVYPKYKERWARTCLAYNDHVKTYVESTGSLKYAVLSSYYLQYLDEDDSYLTRDGRLRQAGLAAFREELVHTLRWLRGRGIEPIVFGPPPRTGHDIGNCLARALWLDESKDRCIIAQADFQPAESRIDALLRSLGPEARHFSFIEHLCDGTTCRVHDAATDFYRDGGHLSYGGSRHLGRQFAFADAIMGREPEPPTPAVAASDYAPFESDGTTPEASGLPVAD